MQTIQIPKACCTASTALNLLVSLRRDFIDRDQKHSFASQGSVSISTHLLISSKRLPSRFASANATLHCFRTIVWQFLCVQVMCATPKSLLTFQYTFLRFDSNAKRWMQLAQFCYNSSRVPSFVGLSKATSRP